MENNDNAWEIFKTNKVTSPEKYEQKSQGSENNKRITKQN
jgi:hypothetical protein